MKGRLSNKRIIALSTVDKTKPKSQETFNSMTSVLALDKHSLISDGIRYSLGYYALITWPKKCGGS